DVRRVRSGQVREGWFKSRPGIFQLPEVAEHLAQDSERACNVGMLVCAEGLGMNLEGSFESRARLHQMSLAEQYPSKHVQRCSISWVAASAMQLCLDGERVLDRSASTHQIPLCTHHAAERMQARCELRMAICPSKVPVDCESA